MEISGSRIFYWRTHAG